MIFFLVALLAGTAILHLTTFKRFKWLQNTVALFVLGTIVSILTEVVSGEDPAGLWARSYSQWVGIDPHLLLFTLLPPLLAGDAMNIDTQVALKVARQCIYLAGPGVVISAFASAGFLYAYLPYDWPFLLCLTVGAILCATDPVAVVALLKELGASPTLTVQIQGESLLNDGTAIVLYTVAYKMLSGQEMDSTEIMIYLLKTALYAWMLGVVIGLLHYVWIKAASDHLDHHSSLIQVSITVSCAYVSFSVAEGLFHISGVLATVAASLVLAHFMWPKIVGASTMHRIWHMFEYLGNTVIFFLAGVLTGNSLTRVSMMDYVHLFVIYLALLVIRAALIFSSIPLLKLLHTSRQSVKWEDAAIMSWGGLRGAVGLALAMIVNIDKAAGRLTQQDADRALFYVGGVAMLTLMINASTCPMLVKRLGVTQLPQAKQQMMLLIVSQLQTKLEEKDLEQYVSDIVGHVLEDLQGHLKARAESKPLEINAQRASLQGSSAEADGENTGERDMTAPASFLTRKKVKALSDPTVDLIYVRSRFEELAERQLNRIKKFIPANPLQTCTCPEAGCAWHEMINVVQTCPMDDSMVSAANQALLSLVHSEYMDGSRTESIQSVNAEMLLSSILAARHKPYRDLLDYQYLKRQMGWEQAEKEVLARGSQQIRTTTKRMSLVSEDNLLALGQDGWLHRLVTSQIFGGVVIVLIFANAAFVIFEPEEGQELLFLVLETVFTFLFTLEFALRAYDGRLRFFENAWNLFDFMLVLLGLVSVLVAILYFGHTENLGAKTQGARLVQVFKKMRFVRIVRLYHIITVVLRVRQTGVEEKTRAAHIAVCDMLVAFIGAHITAQNKLVEYFGQNHLEHPELTRAILQSQVSIYKATLLFAMEDGLLEEWVIEEERYLQGGTEIIGEIENMVQKSTNDGILNAREARNFMHTIGSQRKKYMKGLASLRSGSKLALEEPGEDSWQEKDGVDMDGNASDVKHLDLARIDEGNTPRQSQASGPQDLISKKPSVIGKACLRKDTE